MAHARSLVSSPSALPRTEAGAPDLVAVDAALEGLRAAVAVRPRGNGRRATVAQLLAELDALAAARGTDAEPRSGGARTVPPRASVRPGAASEPPPEMVLQESEVLLDEIPEEERGLHDAPVSTPPPSLSPPSPVEPLPAAAPVPVVEAVAAPEPEPISEPVAAPEPEPISEPVAAAPEPEPEPVAATPAPEPAAPEPLLDLELDLPPLNTSHAMAWAPPSTAPASTTSTAPRGPTRYPSGILPAVSLDDLNLDDLPAPPPVPRGMEPLPSLRVALPPLDDDEVTELETAELLEEETRKLPGRFARPSPRPGGSPAPSFVARPLPPPPPMGTGATRPPPPLPTPPRKPDPQK
jgi:hypothetical protein